MGYLLVDRKVLEDKGIKYFETMPDGRAIADFNMLKVLGSIDNLEVVATTNELHQKIDAQVKSGIYEPEPLPEEIVPEQDTEGEAQVQDPNTEGDVNHPLEGQEESPLEPHPEAPTEGLEGDSTGQQEDAPLEEQQGDATLEEQKEPSPTDEESAQTEQEMPKAEKLTSEESEKTESEIVSKGGKK